jgi:hypothetical protein
MASMIGGLFGRGGQGQQQPPQESSPNASSGARRPARSLGDIARREAEEKEERNKREGKNNTYFGGDSTEFEGK